MSRNQLIGLTLMGLAASLVISGALLFTGHSAFDAQCEALGGIVHRSETVANGRIAQHEISCIDHEGKLIKLEGKIFQ